MSHTPDVVIAGGGIRAVGPAESVRYPKDARVIDARGKTIIPALINLHGHLGLTRDGLSQSFMRQSVLTEPSQHACGIVEAHRQAVRIWLFLVPLDRDRFL